MFISVYTIRLDVSILGTVCANFDAEFGVYMNPSVALQAKNKLYAKVQELIAQVERNPEENLHCPGVKKYLIVWIWLV